MDHWCSSRLQTWAASNDSSWTFPCASWGLACSQSAVVSWCWVPAPPAQSLSLPAPALASARTPPATCAPGLLVIAHPLEISAPTGKCIQTNQSGSSLHTTIGGCSRTNFWWAKSHFGFCWNSLDLSRFSRQSGYCTISNTGACAATLTGCMSAFTPNLEAKFSGGQNSLQCSNRTVAGHLLWATLAPPLAASMASGGSGAILLWKWPAMCKLYQCLLQLVNGRNRMGICVWSLIWEQLRLWCHSLQYPSWVFATFSLDLSSSNMSWISFFQSSCMVWKEAWGVVTNDELAISFNISRISWNVGRLWGSGSQHPAQHSKWPHAHKIHSMLLWGNAHTQCQIQVHDYDHSHGSIRSKIKAKSCLGEVNSSKLYSWVTFSI